ncbi:MAG: PAS domain-containing sensor histidine kinase [Micrococcales bacterium]|nr:PAS domain-containing sensor histidine kinase [Micrococcales bacterium]
MATLSVLTERYGPLPPADVEWLHQLVGDWQVVSDLAFADLVLWLPLDEGGFVAIAQCRPSTGATVHYDDVVGSYAPEEQRAQLRAAFDECRLQRSSQPRWYGDFAVREEAVPVVHGGRPIAVMARQTNLGGARTPSRLELNYVEAADDLVAMIARGEYPLPDAPSGSARGAPRVGDGLVRLNADGEVIYASPNALSCFHRLGVMGDLVGSSLVEVTADLLDAETPRVDEALPLVLLGKAPWRADVESHGVAVSVRAVPLTEDGERTGAALLCRDVSELRRRERELITKDATIREIHHRVKNNLQTVAALLRLQSRRVQSADARAALAEAMRRVATIALVHETLSQTLDETVEFDEVVSRALRLTADVTAGEQAQVRTVMEGSFGQVSAETATALALVLTELVTNAVEHGFAGKSSGTVRIVVEREDDHLRVEVADDGRGLPTASGIGSGLGTQIVSTLVANELGGSIVWHSEPEGGTSVVIEMRVRPAQPAVPVG